jgi:hypothetical protein
MDMSCNSLYGEQRVYYATWGVVTYIPVGAEGPVAAVPVFVAGVGRARIVIVAVECAYNGIQSGKGVAYPGNNQS